MKQKLLLGSLVTVLISIFCFAFIPHYWVLQSAVPTNVKDVLDNSELSYFSRIGVAVTAGDSIITINQTSGTVPSITTNNLFIGDTIAIGTSGAGTGVTGPLTSYIVKDIASTASLIVNQVGTSLGIGVSNAFVGAAVIATRSAQHTFYWTPQSNLTGGFWQFLIKASSRAGETYNDGIPDQNGFDVGASTPSNSTGTGARLRISDVTCPQFGGGTQAFSVGTTVQMGANYYNVITCQLGAGDTNQIGVGYSMTIGINSTSPELINPTAKDSSHVEGTADVYTFYVLHQNAAQVVQTGDSMKGQIAVVESVRVTATIDPYITFQVGTSGTAGGQLVCNNTLSGQANSVTADTVPFGSLLGSGFFNDLAQWISCSTNSDNGYAVTVYEGPQMHNQNGDGVTIPDTSCDAGGCGVGTTGVWRTDNTHSKWGFGMQNINASYTPINIGAGTTFYAEAFGNGPASATVVMRNTVAPLTNEAAYMCYRLTNANSQEAGNYESKLIYTATATF